MTELRDARLKKALESAPDADARPAPSVAHAIRAAARNVLPTGLPKKTPDTWWQLVWKCIGHPRSAWGAAFATVLVAVLVTALWVHEPIPDARPVAPAAGPVAPAADASQAEASTQKSTPAPAPMAQPQTPSRPVTEAKRMDAARDAPQPTVPTPAPAAVPATAPAIAMEPATARLSVTPQESAMGAQTPKQSEVTKSLIGPQARTTSAMASQRSVARSLAPAPLADNVPTAKAVAEVSRLEVWDTLTVQVGGSTVKLDRATGKDVYALMLRLQQSTSTFQDAAQSEPTTAPDVLIEVQAKGQVTTTFTLNGQNARWSRPGRSVQSATLTDAQTAQLLQVVREAAPGEALR